MEILESLVTNIHPKQIETYSNIETFRIKCSSYCQPYLNGILFVNHCQFLFKYLNKIDNGYCISSETSLYLNMFQFVLAVLFSMKI